MSDLKTIREAVRASLQSKLGIESQQLSGYVLKNFNPPVCWVRPVPSSPVQYNLTLGVTGVQLWHLLVELFTGSIDDIAAQQAIDVFLSPGPTCVYEALVADPTFGGKLQTSHVTAVNAYIEFERADSSIVIGASWALDVYP